MEYDAMSAVKSWERAKKQGKLGNAKERGGRVGLVDIFRSKIGHELRTQVGMMESHSNTK